jgi:hypothetical protein
MWVLYSSPKASKHVLKSFDLEVKGSGITIVDHMGVTWKCMIFIDHCPRNMVFFFSNFLDTRNMATFSKKCSKINRIYIRRKHNFSKRIPNCVVQKNDKICRQKKSLPITNYIWGVASNETMQLTDTWLWTPKKWFIKPLSCSTNNSKVVRTVLNCPDLLIDSQLHAMKRMKPPPPSLCQ